jgi:lipopolysaccharide transport system ATP-binding protein
VWALRDVTLELRRGQRLGVIGRNGAGKTTMLKLIGGNYAATEGAIVAQGRVHALMDAGAGFHPELTGRENVDAALTLQGLQGRELAAAAADAIEFAELTAVIDQPLRTYSHGMWARLAFATATALQPDVLVVDEVLGAGDASFAARSAERIRAMTGNGGAMLVVSHSMEQILQLCSEAVWLERGRVQMTGSAFDVVKAYQRFVREREVSVRCPPGIPAGKQGRWSRWPGEGSLTIVDMTLSGADGRERAAFEPAEALTLTVQFRASRTDVFPLQLSAVFYRLDGLRVIAPLGPWLQLEMRAGEVRTAALTLDPIQLGNGEYAISVALYKEFDAPAATGVMYDAIDRSVLFRVDGTPPAVDAVSMRPVEWLLRP